MRYSSVSTVLQWGVRVGIWLLLLTPLIVASSWFFPYITGKNFFFRIVVELTFGLWLALIVVDARFRPKRGIVLGAFLAFIGAMGLATVFGADPYHSFWSNYERMEGMVTYLHLAALILVASSVFRSVSDWRLTLHISVAVSLIAAGYGLFELLGVIQIPGSTASTSGIGVFSRLGNQIYLAAYLLFHFFILGFLFFTTKNIWWRAVYIVLTLFEFYIFLHTGTRGALVGLVAGVAAFLCALFLFSLRDNKRLAVYMGILLAGGAVMVGGFFMLRDSAIVQRYPLLMRFADIRLTSSTAQSRFMIWGIAKEAFLERPLLGWGPGNFIIPYAKYYNPNLFGNEPWFDRVHNMHFEWLVAGGAVGFLAYLSVIGSSIFVLWRLWRRRIIDGIIAATLIGFLVAYLVQDTFVFDTVITYLFFVLFLALLQSFDAAVQRERDGQEQRHAGQYSQALLLAPLFVVASIVLAATAHTKQMQVAGGIITMLNGVSTGKTVVDITRQLEEMTKKNTFGTSETRERFVDLLFTVAQQKDGIQKSDLVFLLSRGIDEMKQEAERNLMDVKPGISLAKLLQLRFSVTGSAADRDESIAVYQRLLEQAPHFPATYIGLAEVYLAANDAKQASQLMNEIFQKTTYPNSFIYPLLSVSILSGDHALAAEQVKRHISLGNSAMFPQTPFLDRGEMEAHVLPRLRTVDHTKDTEQFLEVIIAHQKTIPLAFVFLAEVKAELGKYDEARRLAEELRQLYPEYASEAEEFIRSLDAVSANPSVGL